MASNLKHRLKRAEVQRFIALKSAFDTIDAYAIPTLDPYKLEFYRRVKETLLEVYSENIGNKDLKNYKF